MQQCATLHTCTSTALHCSAFSMCLRQFVHSTALHCSASQHVYCVEQHCPAVHCSTVGSAEILLPSCGSAGRACHTDHSHTDICQHKRCGHLITILFPLNLPLRLGFGLFTLTPFLAVITCHCTVGFSCHVTQIQLSAFLTVLACYYACLELSGP